MRAQATTTQSATGCLESKELFQHRLMEDPPTSNAPADERRHYMMMVRKAQNLCAACPLMQSCLYDAITKFDVDGFAAGTTRKQRTEIRARLGVRVEPEDFDTLAGVTAPHRQVDHQEVVRLRNANPHESLETLAQRLGCSLSTVKRHLRKNRHEGNVSPIRKTRVVSMRDVLTAYREVVTPARTSANRAA
ncbi:MAG: helix-turn-helix domain-containing protein [Propionibacteriales bacterium]|nr:helix-turn-helix domain-containing protein [Propionibacteriales bacterium]